MKILSHGKYFDDGRPIQAKCHCGCQVEVTVKEVKRYNRKQYDCRNESWDENYFGVKCPECDDTIEIKDNRLK